MVIKTEYLFHEDNIHIAHRVLSLVYMQALTGGIRGSYFIIGNKKVDRT
jgi:hypothetical protein